MVRFLYVKYTEMLSFFLIAEALTGLIYHRPPSKNSSFQFQDRCVPQSSVLSALLFLIYVIDKPVFQTTISQKESGLCNTVSLLVPTLALTSLNFQGK